MKKIITTTTLLLLTFNYAYAFDTSEIFKTSISIFNSAATEIAKQIDNQINKSGSNKPTPAPTPRPTLTKAPVENRAPVENKAPVQQEQPVTNKTVTNKTIAVQKNVNSNVTDSSLIDLVFKTDYNAKNALLIILKDGNEEKIVLPVKSGLVETNISLKFGPGQYTIKIFQSNENQKYGINYSYINTIEVVNNDTRDMLYLLPSTEVQSNNDEIISLSNSITLTATNDLEKVKLIHDYVAELITYDYEAAKDPNRLGKEMDALSILREPLTICSGYSNFFAALVRAQGIKTKVIYGDAFVKGQWFSHAWNEVLINNQWQIVDVTWDDTDELRYDYFMPSIEKFSRDHKNGVVQNNL